MTGPQEVLERVTRVPGVRGALVASAGDGLVIAEQLMDGVDGRAAAALAGSLVGRLARTAGELDRFDDDDRAWLGWAVRRRLPKCFWAKAGLQLKRWSGG